MDEVYTPESLPGLGTTTTFLHTQATVGFDSRAASGYARRGGFYGVTGHDYTDRDDALGFRQVDYEAIQHIPDPARDLGALAARAGQDDVGQERPGRCRSTCCRHVGGGSSLRGFSSYRFSDRNSLLLQAEWRIIANRFFESAVFYDAGKVTARTSDLDLNHLKTTTGSGCGSTRRSRPCSASTSRGATKARGSYSRQALFSS